MPNYKLTLCYDGTRWKGWQRQGNTGTTLQGRLEELLTRLLDQPVEVAGSGRTDAGAHARGQVVSFRARTALTPEELLTGLRRYLPADVGATEALRSSMRAARTGDEPFFDRGPGYARLSGGATSNEFDVL